MRVGTMTGRIIGLGFLVFFVQPFRVEAAEPPPSTVTLNAVVDSTSLLVDDPLLIKCVLKNEGQRAVRLGLPFSSFASGVRFEVRSPNAKEFTRVLAADEGVFCGVFVFGISKGWELPVNTTVVCYSHLHWKSEQEGGGPVFSAAGKWQVRMAVTVDGKVLTSDPVPISVVSRDQRDEKGFREAMQSVGLCLASSGWLSQDDLKRALEAQEYLGSPDASRVIAQARLLRDLRHAGPAKARTMAIIALKRFRSELGPVSREYLDLLTVHVFLHDRKEYDEAKSLLDTITDISVRREQLRAVLLQKTNPIPKEIKD
jgi:hypothetical protein